MLPPAGRYYILNVQWGNVIALPDGNERTELVGLIQGLESQKYGEQWDVTPLSRNRFKIQNDMHKLYLGCRSVPECGDYLFGSSKPRAWYIAPEYGGAAKSNIIRFSSTTDLYCCLEDDTPGTPISLSSNSHTDRCNQWYFELCPPLLTAVNLSLLGRLQARIWKTTDKQLAIASGMITEPSMRSESWQEAAKPSDWTCPTASFLGSLPSEVLSVKGAVDAKLTLPSLELVSSSSTSSLHENLSRGQPDYPNKQGYLFGRDEQQTLRAYAHAMSLIPWAAWMGLPIEGRHEALVRFGDLASEAAAVAARNGLPELALEWVEQGWSIVRSQTLQLRSPIDVLRERDPDRAERLTEVSRLLESNSKDPNLSADKNGRQLRKLTLEWGEILAEVRRMDGFESFLRPRKVAELLPSASFGPVVVLNAHNEGCDALVLMSQANKVIHVQLPFTSKQAGGLVESLEKARCGRTVARHAEFTGRNLNIGAVKLKPEEKIKALLAQLWENVVRPVLETLTFSLPENADCDLPRICWCPTGLLACLPIHAAGLYDINEPGMKLFDFAISSYTPTIAALLQPPSEQHSHPKILAFAQATYTGRGVAPLTKTRQEMECIRSRAKLNSIEVVEAHDGVERVKHIVEEMGSCNWIHLACHSVQNIHASTRSAFILADGNLELEEIIKRPLPHAQFAFLSSCQTAAGDATLPDEAVHLAAGMIFAGYRSVIGTMWSIYDEDGPTVAEEVYSELLKDGKADHTRAAHALHRAVQKLRSSGRPFLAWMPFIHMGV